MNFNFRTIVRLIGLLLSIEGVTMLLSLFVSVLYNGYDSTAFLLSSAICFVPGIVIMLLTRNDKRDISRRDGYLTVTLVWIIFPLFGSLPYMLSGTIPDFTNAYFETMSGFTTTGSTIFTDVEALPHGILFWRSMTQWLGGMGIIVLFIAILPIFGIGGMQLFLAEVPSPAPDKINPRIRQTAKTLWAIYLIFTVAETLLLWLAGMEFFDAVCQSFSTMSTGGFSTKQASIAYWDSPLIHYIIVIFMFLAGTNFTLTYFAVKGNIKHVLKDEEFKYYVLFILVFTLIIFSGLIISSMGGIEKTFRDSIFQVVTIITTTGFATADYMLWPPFLTMLLFALFFFGGSAGSTSGGIKIMRIVLLLKYSYYELRRMVHPFAVVPVKFNNKLVEQKVFNNVMAFFIFYFAIFGLSTVIFSLIEPELESAVGAVASSLGNIGPGLGNVGPSGNFLHVKPAGKWFLSFLMLLGRLELLTVLVLFSPSFWRD